jgi:hypothetical protein
MPELREIKNKIFLGYLETLINNDRLNPTNMGITMKTKVNYYRWLANKCESINRGNKKYKNDKFWDIIARTIVDNRIVVFNEISVKFIENSIKL